MDCHTPEQSRLYERGYPQMALLVDGHKDDKKPAVSATKVFRDYGTYHVKWPRLTAAAFVRGSRALRGFDWSAPAVAEAASATGPVTNEEAAAIVAAAFERRTFGNFNEMRHVLFVLEALTSTDAVLDAIVSGLERLPKERWQGDNDGGPPLIAYLAGFLLLRSPKRAAFTERLEEVYAATVKEGIDEGEHTIRGGLDLALHGNAGAARALARSHWQYWYYYLNVDDADVHLERLANYAKSEWVPEARILYLAGEKLLPVYTSKKALRQGKRLPHILGDFGMLEHEGIVDLMVDMIGVKGAGDAPQNYFRENAAYARPRLEKLARGSGPMAVKAASALSLASS
jgi:hypothetical protein